MAWANCFLFLGSGRSMKTFYNCFSLNTRHLYCLLGDRAKKFAGHLITLRPFDCFGAKVQRGNLAEGSLNRPAGSRAQLGSERKEDCAVVFCIQRPKTRVIMGRRRCSRRNPDPGRKPLSDRDAEPHSARFLPRAQSEIRSVVGLVGNVSEAAPLPGRSSPIPHSTASRDCYANGSAISRDSCFELTVLRIRSLANRTGVGRAVLCALGGPSSG